MIAIASTSPTYEPLFAGTAEGYDELFGRVTRLFIPALLRAAKIAPGHRVLDVATGTGAAAQSAAALVGSSGSVVAGDISPHMLEIAQRNLNGTRVELHRIDGQQLPFADDEFDAAICQLGLMFFDDQVRGLSEFRRVLRPGRWSAVSVTTTPELSLFGRIGPIIGRHVPATAAALNKFFSIPNASRLRELLAAAGFTDIRLQDERRTISFDSFDHYFAGIEQGAGLGGQEYVKLSEALRKIVREEVRHSLSAEMPLEITMQVLVACGRK
jgi:ubiquinone/menaquinone biosynthesis C-methylase UbiE